MEIIRSAPGKVILCGEHSVVYGYPAIAVPVSGVRTKVHIISVKDQTGLRILAEDIGQQFYLSKVQPNNPLAMAAHLVLDTLKCPEPAALLTIKSKLPIAAGMGSGAAVTISIIRALSAFLGNELDNDIISYLTYQVEKIYHGTPSGIDNTVITWERPIYFTKGYPPDFCRIGVPIILLIASSGIAASTRDVIHAVRSRMSAKPSYYQDIFKRIGDLTDTARISIAEGDLHALGALLIENHQLLVDLGVSIPKLDSMVNAALAAGAFGAKLTGSGQGGNIIALVDEKNTEKVKNNLYHAGSAEVWQTIITD
jgi:mevalonate kinase